MCNEALVTFQLTQREVEYVALSRDTTESDLKQRREIRGGSAHYVDQVSNVPGSGIGWLGCNWEYTD